MKKRLCRMLRAHSWREGRGDAASTTKKGPSTKTGEGISNCLLESTSAQILSGGLDSKGLYKAALSRRTNSSTPRPWKNTTSLGPICSAVGSLRARRRRRRRSRNTDFPDENLKTPQWPNEKVTNRCLADR